MIENSFEMDARNLAFAGLQVIKQFRELERLGKLKWSDTEKDAKLKKYMEYSIDDLIGEATCVISKTEEVKS